MIITEKNIHTINKSDSVYLVDFANVVYILINHYSGNVEKVMRAFNFFFEKMYASNCSIIVVSKKTTDISLVEIFNYERKNHELFHNFLQSGRLIIYDLQYSHPISSSIDDLFFNLIMIDVYTTFPLKKLHLITNDKQKLNKHLFGLSKKEDYDELHILCVTDSPNGFYVYKEHRNSKKIKKILNNLSVASIEHTRGLQKCIPSLSKLFTVCRKRKCVKNNYNTISKKYYINRNLRNKCLKYNNSYGYTQKNKHTLSLTNYLYAYAKYIQTAISGSFYGNMSVSSIIHLFAESN